MKMTLTGAAMLAALLASSCATFAPAQRTGDEVSVPDAFSLYDDTAAMPEQWWTSFESEELDGLVTQAMKGNLSLQQVYARLVQAEMVARQAGASLYPTLSITGDASVTQRHTDTGESAVGLDTVAQRLSALGTLAGGDQTTTQATTGLEALASDARTAQSKINALNTLTADLPSSEQTFTTESYRFGLSSSYEADLWGRVRAEDEAALLDFEAAAQDAYTAMLSLSGSVVRQWLTIAAYNQELALVTRQLKSNQTTLELMELRYRKGMATALDVYQQRQIVAKTESLVPVLEAGLQVARNELAVLIGQYPSAGSAPEVGIDTLPVMGPIPEPGLPADLLANRPDVRAAGLRLRASDWRVAAARADRLPSLRLTGSATYGADEWDLVFSNWMTTLAGSLTGPIFDAGRRKAEVLRTRAVVDERLSAYRQTVLVAVKEVESALYQETKQGAYIESLERQREAAQLAYEQAQERYRKGMNDYLPVLSALSDLQVVERTIVEAKLNQLGYRVQLQLALGGSWMRQEDAALKE